MVGTQFRRLHGLAGRGKQIAACWPAIGHCLNPKVVGGTVFDRDFSSMPTGRDVTGS